MPQQNIGSGSYSETDNVEALSEEKDRSFDNIGYVIESRLKESEQDRKSVV